MRRYLLSLGMLGLVACGHESKPGQASQALSRVETGKVLFQQKCGICHLMKSDAAAPALQGVLDRWGGDSARLKAFIRNPQQAITDQDPEAVKVYDKWKPAMMTPYPQLTEEDLNALIAYFQSSE